MDRRQQLISQLEASIKEIEEWLIETPREATEKAYKARLDQLQEYQKMLKMIKEM